MLIARIGLILAATIVAIGLMLIGVVRSSGLALPVAFAALLALFCLACILISSPPVFRAFARLTFHFHLQLKKARPIAFVTHRSLCFERARLCNRRLLGRLARCQPPS